MDYKTGRQAVDEVRREYEQINYDVNQILFPTTRSTLGMLIMGEVARSKNEYDRSYQIYNDVFRRLRKGQEQCSENLSEIPYSVYKKLTLRRLGRLVNQLEHDDEYSPKKYFYQKGDPIIDFAKQLIIDMRNYRRD